MSVRLFEFRNTDKTVFFFDFGDFSEERELFSEESIMKTNCAAVII